MDRQKLFALLSLTMLIASTPVNIQAVGDTDSPFQKIYKNYIKTINPTTAGIVALGVGLPAIVGLVWWISTDRRSDEQVLVDAQRLALAATNNYDNMMRIIEASRLAFHTDIDEQLLSQIMDMGVDEYYIQYLDKTINTITREMKTISERIARCKVDHMSNRMKTMQNDLQVVLQWLTPLQRFFHYHESFFKLHKVFGVLEKTHTQSRSCKTSQKKLVSHVISQASAFASYPYITYVEKIDQDIHKLKSAMKHALYAKNTKLMVDAQELCDDLLVIKGTVASTKEYQEDIAKRERDRIKQEQERQRVAQQLAQQEREEAANRKRIQLKQKKERIALEQQQKENEHQKELKKARKQKQLLQDQAARQEAERQAYQQQLREEQERSAWQQQQEQWHAQQLQQQAYYQSNVYPSAPEMENSEYAKYQMPEPSAPPIEPENTELKNDPSEDIEAQFGDMLKGLDFETQETDQFQKDFGLADGAD